MARKLIKVYNKYFAQLFGTHRKVEGKKDASWSIETMQGYDGI